MGLTLDQVYQEESHFAVDNIGPFNHGQGIFDVMCGSGNHARIMKRLLGDLVAIHGLDGSEALYELAKTNLDNSGISFELGQLEHARIVPPFAIKAITCLGNSFAICPSYPTLINNLIWLYDILVPSGVIFLQSRKPVKPIPHEVLQQLGVKRLGNRYLDLVVGDSISQSVSLDADHFNIDRSYTSADGIEYPFPRTIENNFFTHFYAAAKVLEDIGFKNAQLVTKPLGRGYYNIWAIRAMK